MKYVVNTTKVNLLEKYKEAATATYAVASQNELFHNLDLEAYTAICAELSTRIVTCKKGEVVMLQGDPVTQVGLVISGGLHISKEDGLGNVVLLTEIGSTELFAEVFACAAVMASPVTVTAVMPTTIAFFDWKKMLKDIIDPSPHSARLINNMLRLVAQKTLLLNNRIEILSKRTIRERLFCYFTLVSDGNASFSIPYNRNELANLLSVDRSALSAELSKLRGEGVLEYHKNRFRLLQ